LSLEIGGQYLPIHDFIMNRNPLSQSQVHPKGFLDAGLEANIHLGTAAVSKTLEDNSPRSPLPANYFFTLDAMIANSNASDAKDSWQTMFQAFAQTKNAKGVFEFSHDMTVHGQSMYQWLSSQTFYDVPERTRKFQEIGVDLDTIMDQVSIIEASTDQLEMETHNTIDENAFVSLANESDSNENQTIKSNERTNLQMGNAETSRLHLRGSPSCPARPPAPALPISAIQNDAAARPDETIEQLIKKADGKPAENPVHDSNAKRNSYTSASQVLGKDYAKARVLGEVCQIDLRTGLTVNVFKSYTDAARNLITDGKNVINQRKYFVTEISQVVAGKKVKCRLGYGWKFIGTPRKRRSAKEMAIASQQSLLQQTSVADESLMVAEPAATAQEQKQTHASASQLLLVQDESEWDCMFEQLKPCTNNLTGEYIGDKKTPLYRWFLQQEFLFRLRETGASDALSDERLERFKTLGYFADSKPLPLPAAKDELVLPEDSQTASKLQVHRTMKLDGMGKDFPSNLACVWESKFEELKSNIDKGLEVSPTKTPELWRWIVDQRVSCSQSVDSEIQGKLSLSQMQMDKLLALGLDLPVDLNGCFATVRAKTVQSSDLKEMLLDSSDPPSPLPSSCIDELPVPVTTVSDINSQVSEAMHIVRQQLPNLDVSAWFLPEECYKYCCGYNNEKGCRDGHHCRYIHTQNPWGDEKLEMLWSESDKQLPGHVEECYNDCVLVLSSGKGSCRWYTAQYNSARRRCSDGDRKIVFCEGGPTAAQSEQGIFWYPTREDAMAALEKVVIITYWATLKSIPFDSHHKGIASEAIARRVEFVSFKNDRKHERLRSADCEPDSKLTSKGLPTSAAGRTQQNDDSKPVFAHSSKATRHKSPMPVDNEFQYYGRHNDSESEGANRRRLSNTSTSYYDDGCQAKHYRSSSPTRQLRRCDLPLLADPMWIHEKGDRGVSSCAEFCNENRCCYGRECPYVHVLNSSVQVPHPKKMCREYFSDSIQNIEKRIICYESEGRLGDTYYTAWY
jgi:hypothetical protein